MNETHKPGSDAGADPVSHDLYRVAATRGDRGKRTVFYGYCRCGFGIGASVSVASVEAKHARHVASVRAVLDERAKP